jgi:Flp pilus assembly protein TadG
MVVFALALPVILIMAGLGVDVGNVYMQRRAAQSAADAAALAVSRCLLRQATSATNDCRPTDASYSPSSAPAEQDAKDAAEYWVARNSYGPTNTITSLNWTLNDGSISALNAAHSTASTSPDDANGVALTIRRSFPPIFLSAAFAVLGRVLPTEIANSGNLYVDASATAQVGAIVVGSDSAPVAGCGPSMFTGLGSTTYDIFQSGTTEIDYDTYEGQTFVLQSSQLWKNESHPPCPFGNGNADWKGTINPSGNVTLPSNVTLNTGNSAADLDGACTNTGQSAPGSGCYLLVPITDDNNTTKGSAHVVAFACMEIGSQGNGTIVWSGTLRDPSLCTSHYAYDYSSWRKSDGAGHLTHIALRV